MVNLAENNSRALVGTAVGFLVVTYVAVALRTYVRSTLTRSFQLDDWLMLVAQTIFTISCTFILLGVKTGLGKHNKALEQQYEIKALMWQALATATYILDMMFVKLSYAVFLLRLAVQRRYTYTLYTSMFVVAVWSTVLFFWDIFQCRPVRAQWDYTIPGEVCISSKQIVDAAYALSAMAIVSDWLYALLPIFMIRNVRMTRQEKTIVIVLLSLGIFASIATIIRIRFLSDLNITEDILYAGTDAMVWTLIEPGVAIVAASLVTIRPLLQTMRVKGFRSPENSRNIRMQDPNQPRTGTGGARAYGRTGMPGFAGPGNTQPGDLESGDAGPMSDPPSKRWVDGVGFSMFNDSNVSLQTMPMALKKASLPWRQVPQADEVPLSDATKRSK